MVPETLVAFPPARVCPNLQVRGEKADGHPRDSRHAVAGQHARVGNRRHKRRRLGGGWRHLGTARLRLRLLTRLRARLRLRIRLAWLGVG
eukprot:1194436-Prorocentrum_minimum.AAC.1